MGKDGRGGRTRGEGGRDDDEQVVVVPRNFCRHQGGWRAGDNDGVRRCPPEFLTTTRGHICAPLFLPAASSTGAGVNPTRRPLFDFDPPHWGVSSPASLTMTGAACALHAAPFLFFTPKGCFPPFWGDSFFFSVAVSSTGAVYDPPTPLPSFPSIYQGFFLSCPLLCT